MNKGAFGDIETPGAGGSSYSPRVSSKKGCASKPEVRRSFPLEHAAPCAPMRAFLLLARRVLSTGEKGRGDTCCALSVVFNCVDGRLCP